MSGPTLRDKVQKEDKRKGLGIANNEVEIKKSCLRWFVLRHVQIRDICESVKE